MDIKRGFRDKLEKYLNLQESFEVEMSVQGKAVYDYCCFGVDSEDKLSDDRYMIFYNQPFSPKREISYNRVNNSAIFTVKLFALPTSIERIVFTVSIDGSGTMGKIDHHKVCLKQKGQEVLSLLLRGQDFKLEKAIISLEIYRKGVWRVGVIAQGFNGGLGDLLRNYGGEELVEATDTVVPIPQMNNSWATNTNLSANLPTSAPARPSATSTQSENRQPFQPLPKPEPVANLENGTNLPHSVAAARAAGPTPSWSVASQAAATTPSSTSASPAQPTLTAQVADARPVAMDQSSTVSPAVTLKPANEEAPATLSTSKALKPVSLKKGQKVSLEKNGGGQLKKAMIGLGWDEAEEVKNYYDNFDCDASVIACQGSRLVRHEDLVYFQNLHHDSGCIVHMGDNLTGEGEGDCEQIYIDLDNLPKVYDRLIVVANIYQAKKRQQHFGMINNSYIRICDADSNKELCRFELSHKYDGMTAMLFGELVRKEKGWEFKALGEGTQDGSIRTLARRCMENIWKSPVCL
ncbi:TPA: hypothetical protein DD394_03870 [bacterium UBP9_UBA11836]|nr:hypothetical protein [bacterium UBP9_UBA11836]